jgi:tripartite-type tricarboxylate transporter receptor subunit TctC
MVSTFAAGGTADVLTRLVADHLTVAFKQQFFVETRAGAGGAIGVQSVANSPPDGYNFVLSNITQLVLLPLSNPKLGYDPQRDLINIAYVAGAPIMLSVNAGSGVRTYQDFIAHGKKAACADLLVVRRRQLGHLVGGVRAEGRHQGEHVPYKGASQGLMDWLPALFSGTDRVVDRGAGARQGAQRHRASHTARLPDFPDVPTFKEMGIISSPGSRSPGQRSCSTRREMNARIVAAVSSQVQQRLRRGGLIAAMSVEQLKATSTPRPRWKPVLEQAGLIGK